MTILNIWSSEQIAIIWIIKLMLLLYLKVKYAVNNRDGTEEQIEILSQRFMIWTLKDTDSTSVWKVESKTKDKQSK